MCGWKKIPIPQLFCPVPEASVCLRRNLPRESQQRQWRRERGCQQQLELEDSCRRTSACEPPAGRGWWLSGCLLWRQKHGVRPLRCDISFSECLLGAAAMFEHLATWPLLKSEKLKESSCGTGPAPSCVLHCHLVTLYSRKRAESWSLESLRGVRWCSAALCHLPGADVEAELWLCCCSLGAPQTPKEHPEQGAGITSLAQQGWGHRKAVLLRRWLGYKEELRSSSPPAQAGPAATLLTHGIPIEQRIPRTARVSAPPKSWRYSARPWDVPSYAYDVWPALLQMVSGKMSLLTTEIKTCLLSHSCSSKVLPSLQGVFPLEWYSQVFKEILLLKSDMMDVLAQHKRKHPWASWESFCLQLSGCNTDPSPKLCLEVLHGT